MLARDHKGGGRKMLTHTLYLEFINHMYPPMSQLMITARGGKYKRKMEGLISVEIKSAKSSANNRARHAHRYIDAFSRKLDRLYQSGLKWLSFLLFEEKEPKHKVAHDLRPIHALTTFYFCLFAPSLIFFWLMPMGFFVFCTGETLLVLTVLEVMHVVYDR